MVNPCAIDKYFAFFAEKRPFKANIFCKRVFYLVIGMYAKIRHYTRNYEILQSMRDGDALLQIIYGR
ncbi:hypothetical protein COU37_04485 [Candidatus Micrarchaeota archaeon CG10_big_fil_rev_8_21_14_0_10_45_29]|nr:MAG: hypothetical protein COU37_04485 [Candidatus Micrarchaeota archaeon CG10_big_fil_rev_8_21_14_0_10_45_29]